jgi:uncharacterized SAM-binding protein YcdF (DUF218 family)
MKPLKIIVFLVVLAFCTWVFGLAAFAGGVIFLTPDQPNQKTDAIVVLTGGKDRIETGLALFSENLAPNLFITGVHDDVTLPEILNRYRGQKPLPECCVILGYKAESTFENAAEAREWMAGQKIKTIRLVTSNYHMPRAYLDFHGLMPDVKIIKNPIMQPDITPSHVYFWHMIFKEYHKTIFRYTDSLIVSL